MYEVSVFISIIFYAKSTYIQSKKNTSPEQVFYCQLRYFKNTLSLYIINRKKPNINNPFLMLSKI
jgi:hypothetical protein